MRSCRLSPGPFLQLDAEQVEEEVSSMWRTMHKLTRTLADQPQPKRSAELYKMKLHEFKDYLPLLQTFCNQGLRDRHWKRVHGRRRGRGGREGGREGEGNIVQHAGESNSSFSCSDERHCWL